MCLIRSPGKEAKSSSHFATVMCDKPDGGSIIWPNQACCLAQTRSHVSIVDTFGRRAGDGMSMTTTSAMPRNTMKMSRRSAHPVTTHGRLRGDEMGRQTNISWAQSTWNPTSGCREVSPGCDNCYARELAERLRGSNAYPVGFDFMLRPKALELPLKWKQPRRIFTNSTSDLFHHEMPDYYLIDVWNIMLKADWHIYQMLTKRPHVAARKIAQLGLKLPPHIWFGVSVENQQMADIRMPQLVDIPAAIRWVSVEPQLGPVNLRAWLDSIHWWVDGGESGSRRRSADVEWFRSNRDQCLEAGVAYFHKQGNGLRPGMDRLIDGVVWEQYPDDHAEPRQPENTQGVLV